MKISIINNKANKKFSSLKKITKLCTPLCSAYGRAFLFMRNKNLEMMFYTTLFKHFKSSGHLRKNVTNAQVFKLNIEHVLISLLPTTWFGVQLWFRDSLRTTVSKTWVKLDLSSRSYHLVKSSFQNRKQHLRKSRTFMCKTSLFPYKIVLE